MILNECGCMAREGQLPSSFAAAMPMLDILGYGDDMMMDSPGPGEAHRDYDSDPGIEYEDSDNQEESSMIKNNLYTIAQQSQDLHDALAAGDDLPEWVQEKIAVAAETIDVIYDYLNAESAHMHEARKPWYMKKRRNMKKTNETEWYDIPKTKKKRSKKKVDEGSPDRIVGKKPPQSTKLNPRPEDEGKSFAGNSSTEDLGADGKPNRPKKMRDFDIYKDHR